MSKVQFEAYQNLYPIINTVIDKTIYEDISNFYNLKTVNLHHLKRIISFLASIPPGKVNTNNLANHLGIDHKTAAHYIEILLRTRMIRALYPPAHGNKILSRPVKIYLDNTTLLSSVNTLLAEPLDLGTERELAFLQLTMGAEIPVFYSDIGDFQIHDTVFELGGKNKTWQQLKNHQGSKYLVKDDVLIGMKQEIPLYLFGFLY